MNIYVYIYIIRIYPIHLLVVNLCRAHMIARFVFLMSVKPRAVKSTIPSACNGILINERYITCRKIEKCESQISIYRYMYDIYLSMYLSIDRFRYSVWSRRVLVSVYICRLYSVFKWKQHYPWIMFSSWCRCFLLYRINHSLFHWNCVTIILYSFVVAFSRFNLARMRNLFCPEVMIPTFGFGKRKPRKPWAKSVNISIDIYIYLSSIYLVSNHDMCIAEPTGTQETRL